MLGVIASSGSGLSVDRARPTLEDVFRRLTGEGDAGAGHDGVRRPAPEGARGGVAARRLPVVARLPVMGMISPLTARSCADPRQTSATS